MISRKSLGVYSALALIGLSLLVEYSGALRCLDCNDGNKACTGTIINYSNIGIEQCNSRCFVRRTANNVTYRGCDSRYWYPQNETIPDNGCTYRSDGLLWCWCKFGDLCNVFSELLLATLGGNNPCYYNPCQNAGICYLFSTSNLTYACYCQPMYTGRNCEVKVVPPPDFKVRKH